MKDLCTRYLCTLPLHPLPHTHRAEAAPREVPHNHQILDTCEGKGIFHTRKITAGICCQVQPLSEVQGSRGFTRQYHVSLRRDVLFSHQDTWQWWQLHTLLHGAVLTPSEVGTGRSTCMVQELTPALTRRQSLFLNPPLPMTSHGLCADHGGFHCPAVRPINDCLEQPGYVFTYIKILTKKELGHLLLLIIPSSYPKRAQFATL